MTPKQRAFAQSYAKNPNAVKAAKEAGYSDQYADKKAARALLNHPEVIAEIKRIRERMNQQADKTATDVVNEFSKIAFVDRVSFLKEDPLRDGEYMYKAPHELSQAQRDIVEKTTMHTAEIVIVEKGKNGADSELKSFFRQEYNYVLSDKANALEKMGRHFGIFDDKLRISGSQANPFQNVSQKQLDALKKSWVETMTDTKLVEGEYEVVNKK
jgi:phage terminase small subunit